jgi:phage tail sheath gpL-like
MGGQDGYIRKYDDAEKNDEGSNAIDAYCTLGPFQAFNKMRRMGQISEMSARLGVDSDGVDVQVYSGDSAETVVNAVKNADTPKAAVTMTGGGQRPVYRPKTKGAVFAVQLRNNNASERFAIERITAKITDAGEAKGV